MSRAANTVKNIKRRPVLRLRRYDDPSRERWDSTLAGITDISRILSSNLDLDTIWDALHDYINITFDTTSFFVALYDYERDRLTFPLLSKDGLRDEQEPVPVCGMSRAVILHGIELDVRDREAEGERLASLGIEWDEREPGSWGRAWLGVPLRSRRGEVTGLIALQNLLPNSFDDGDLAMLQAIAAPLALSLDSMRMNEAERERRMIAAALMEIGQLAGGSLEDDDLLENLLDQYQRVVSYDSASVLLPSRESGSPEFARAEERILLVSASHDPDAFLSGAQFRYSEDSPLAQSLDSQQPVVISTAEDFAGWWEGDPPDAAQYGSWLLVPMNVREQVVGLVLLGKLAQQAYTQKDASSAFALARQGAIAYETSRLQTQQRANLRVLQQRTRHLGSIHRINTVITSLLDRDDVLRTTAELLTELFESDHCGIVMIAEHGDDATLAAEYPDTGGAGLRIPLVDNETMDWMMRYGTAVVIDDVADDTIDDPTRSALRELGVRSTLIAPLIMRDRLIGSIGIDMTSRQRKFTGEECETLVTIAGQVAIAVSHAKLYEEALAASRLKSAFLANTSHELRTPLNAIIGYSEMLLGGTYGDLNDQQRDRLARVSDSGKHLLSLIDNVLDLSQIESGQVSLMMQTLRASDSLDDLIREIMPHAQAKNLTLEVSINPHEPPVRVDHNSLRRIAAHLLENAVKFTASGGVRVELAPATTEQAAPPKRLRVPSGDWLALRVIDTGIGIRPEDQEIIFESFRQVDSSTGREYEGNGLGLAITHRLVELNQGYLWVESALNAGSTFTVLLPAAQDAAL